MRVKQRLRINTAVTALAFIALSAVLLVTAQRVIRAMEQNEIAAGLLTAQFERLAIRTDYLHTGSERAREQVRAKNLQVGELLKSAAGKFSDPADQKIVALLVEGQEAIGKIFRAIVANRRDAGPKGRNVGLSGEIEARLLNQLNMRVYESVLLGAKLQESSSTALVSALGSGSGWIALVFLVMGAVTLINSWTMNRAIADRIWRLRDGAMVIGEGDLDHRIGIRGDDEFAELSGAFDEMTVKLRGSYHNLEREIEERRQAEAALREKNEELTRLNRAMVGRELRMIELKEEVNAFCAESDRPPRYKLDAGA